MVQVGSSGGLSSSSGTGAGETGSCSGDGLCHVLVKEQMWEEEEKYKIILSDCVCTMNLVIIVLSL